MHDFGFRKVSPAKQLLIQQVGFVNLRHFFKHRSHAKHWFKNLKILEYRGNGKSHYDLWSISRNIISTRVGYFNISRSSAQPEMYFISKSNLKYDYINSEMLPTFQIWCCLLIFSGKTRIKSSVSFRFLNYTVVSFFKQ